MDQAAKRSNESHAKHVRNMQAAKCSLFDATSIGLWSQDYGAASQARQLRGVERQLGAAVGEWRLDDMAKARATAKQQTEPALLMERSVRRSARSLHLWCLLVFGEVLGQAGGATCAEQGFTAPSEAKASFVGSGGTLGDFIVSLNGRYVKTAVMAPSAGWLALATLPEQLERR